MERSQSSNKKYGRAARMGIGVFFTLVSLFTFANLSGFFDSDAADRDVLSLQARANGASLPKGMSPLIPLPAPTGSLPLFQEAVRDLELAKHRPGDEGEATRLAHEIKELRTDLAQTKGERATELTEQTYLAYATLGYYFEDVLTGVIRPDAEHASHSEVVSNLANARTLALQYALALSKITKNQAQKARALYHLNATLFVMGQNKARAADNLRALQKQPLNAALKRNASFIVAQYELGRNENGKQASAVLKSIRANLGVSGAIASDLILAKTVAGDAFRVHLKNATSRVGKLSMAQKEQVFAYAVAVWRHVEKNNWNNPPFNVRAFSDLPSSSSIAERSALQSWNEGNLTAAIHKYEALSRSFKGKPLKADLDLRVLDMRRQDYAKSKNPKDYESALTSAYKVYLDPGILGEKGEAKVKLTAASINERYKALVYGELSRVTVPSVTQAERSRAIGLANNYLPTIDDASQIEAVKAKIANLHVLNKNYKQAVSLYTDLAETKNQENARRYMTLAISSQSILATWPTQAPWSTPVTAQAPAAREQLLSLYKKLGDLAPGQLDWFILAQGGLLDINLGRPEAAFTAWQDGLKKNASSSHAANAAGYMMVADLKAAEWAKLEQLARFCEKAPVAALYRDKPVDVATMLALALLEGGKQALDAKTFAVAVKKLGEFVKRFPRAKNYDEGFFLLSSAYHGNGQHKQSITTLAAFVDRFQSSKYYRQALLNGGDWSAPLAYEENAMSFYARFASEYAKDAEALRVRDTLTDLYMGRGLYAEAASILMAQAKAPQLDLTGKSLALVALMDVEERQGSAGHAVNAADLVLASPGVSEDAKAEALALKARFYASKGQLSQVEQMQAKLSSLGGTSFACQDALGEVRYILAVAKSKDVVKTYFNQGLQDPTATLNQRYASYSQAVSGFKAVCAVGQTSYCAPALHRLARLSEAFLKSLEDVSVQDTLAKEVVDHFQSRKQSIMNEVAKTSQNADDRSVAVVSEGYTMPDWTQAVLWHNKADSDFNRVSGEAGNGFVQWSE